MRGLVLLIAILFVSPAEAATWHADYEKAKQLALKEGKPILLVFR